MFEFIVFILFVVFGLLPIVGGQIGGNFMSYKDSFILGNGIVLTLIAFVIVALLVITSVDYLFFDGISLNEVAVRVYSEF